MPAWIQMLTPVFLGITVLACLTFIGLGAIAAFKTRGRLLRPWLMIAVGIITLLNVYLLTSPIEGVTG